MPTELMQIIDRYVGQLLCFMISFFYRPSKKVPSDIKDVLIIKMFGLGTIVLMTPMVSALRESNKYVNILFLTFEENRDIIKAYGISDQVYGIRRKSLLLFALDTIKTIRVLREKRISVVIDGEFFSRYTEIFSFLIKTGFRTGFYSRDIYRGNMLDFRAYFNPYRHITQSFMELVAPFARTGMSLGLKRPEISITALRNIEKRCPGIDIHNRNHPIILLNPNVSAVSKSIDRSWPLGNFAGMSIHCREKGFQVVFIGGPDDVERSRRAARLSGDGAFSIAGRLLIEETIALMRYSFLLVTNDSGPLHMAVSLGLPTISFFGTESPVIYGHHSGLNKYFWKGLACSPCLSVFNFKRGRCEFNSKCLRDISLKEVIEWFESAEEKLCADYGRRMKENDSYCRERYP